jgi:hypothetical protein
MVNEPGSFWPARRWRSSNLQKVRVRPCGNPSPRRVDGAQRASISRRSQIPPSAIEKHALTNNRWEIRWARIFAGHLSRSYGERPSQHRVEMALSKHNRPHSLNERSSSVSNSMLGSSPKEKKRIKQEELTGAPLGVDCAQTWRLWASRLLALGTESHKRGEGTFILRRTSCMCGCAQS